MKTNEITEKCYWLAERLCGLSQPYWFPSKQTYATREDAETANIEQSKEYKTKFRVTKVIIKTESYGQDI